MNLNPFRSRRERQAAAEAAARHAAAADRDSRANAEAMRQLAGALSGLSGVGRENGRVRPHNAYGGWGQLLFADLTRLRGYSRALLREYEFGGWARRLRDAIISGEPRAPRFSAPVSPDLAADVAAAWADWWCGADGVDGAGTDGATMELKSFWSLIEDGDAFALPWSERDMLRVETRCSGDLAETGSWRTGGPRASGKRTVRFGVELDDHLRATAFWFRSPRDRPGGLPLGLASAGAHATRVPAADVIHAFDPLGTDAFRGMPWITAALIQVLAVKDADISTNNVIALMSLIAATIEHEPEAIGAYQPLGGGGATGGGRDDILVGGKSLGGADDDPQGPTRVQIGDRTVLQLPPGQKLTANTPATETLRFRERIMQSVAAAMCMSYARVTGDASGTSFAALRAGEVDDLTRAREIHALWVKRFRRPIFCRWLVWAIATGRVRVPDDHATMTALRMPMWSPPRRIVADVAKDALALRTGIEAGYMLPSVARERDGQPYDPALDARLDAAWLARIEGKSALDKPAGAAVKPAAGDNTDMDDDDAN